MSILINILIAFHVFVCILMVGVVLMQRPKNEGLGAAFGGGMTENIFGAQTTHVLQKFTVWLGIVFFLITLTLAMLYARRGAGETAIQRELLGQPVPAAAAAAEENAVADVPTIADDFLAVDPEAVAADDAVSAEETTEAAATDEDSAPPAEE